MKRRILPLLLIVGIVCNIGLSLWMLHTQQTFTQRCIMTGTEAWPAASIPPYPFTQRYTVTCGASK